MSLRSIGVKDCKTEIRPWLRLILISGCLMIGWFVVWVTHQNQALFLELHHGLQAMAPEWVWQALSLSGDALWVAAIASIFLAFKERMVFAFALSAIATTACVQVLKRALDIMRPPSIIEPESINMLGDALSLGAFPSGHAATVFLFAGILTVYVHSKWFITLVWVWATLSALSRVAIGVHWPEDILFGAAIGWFFGVSMLLVDPYIGRMGYGKRILLLLVTYLGSQALWLHNPGFPNVGWLQYSTALIGLWFSTQYCSRRVLRIREDVHV